MSEADELIRKLFDRPPPVRRYVIGWPRYAAFYKVGQSWVLHLHLPSGIIHLAHWKWWEPWRILPHALIAHWRVVHRQS